MTTNIYLGSPSSNVVKWIRDEEERKYQKMLKTPLTFTAEEPGAKLSLYSTMGSAAGVTLETSPTGEEGSWTPYTVGTEITLANVGDKIMFRNSSNNIQAMGKSSSGWTQFRIENGKIAASGNIMFLMDKTGKLRDLSGKNYCYNHLFADCTSLTQAPVLPATTLARYCYNYMFLNCTSLTQAPALPATTLAEYCYDYMFAECRSLTQAPTVLPATTLARYCYEGMFVNCTSLTQAPALPATTLIANCYDSMFNGCTSLTQAPSLPATTLISNCYISMFGYCRKLNNINVNFSAWNPTNATNYWVSKVAASGTFTCPAGLPEEFGNNRIPTGWTVVRK